MAVVLPSNPKRPVIRASMLFTYRYWLLEGVFGCGIDTVGSELTNKSDT